MRKLKRQWDMFLEQRALESHQVCKNSGISTHRPILFTFHSFSKLFLPGWRAHYCGCQPQRLMHVVFILEWFLRTTLKGRSKYRIITWSAFCLEKPVCFVMMVWECGDEFVGWWNYAHSSGTLLVSCLRDTQPRVPPLLCMWRLKNWTSCTLGRRQGFKK